ncbi:MAG: Glu-tRNA(Gln) amidotransferase subunit GatD [Candidatus Bathyarchaeota archaeon]|nr:Glu-tRNA(Gln) amidotransferase subunit GatD [Candidatus Bathyarchaeota archaeon]
MSKSEENLGYKGEALDAIKKAGCEVGDIVRVSGDDKIYEGILIPRSESGDSRHVVVKMKSGYNIGIRLSANVKIEKIGKGAKPTFESPPLPPQRLDLPKVVIMSTGGTIASRVDYRTGAVRSAISASDLYGVVPELADLAQVDTQIVLSIYSENLTQQHWRQIAEAAAKNIEEGAQGVVIAHGTDTMAYTAAALSFALQNLPVPVIVVGAQRSSDRPSSDAATNLIGAVNAAAYGQFAEVAIAMHETVADTSIVFNRAARVRKCHTSRRDTFKPVNALPIARATGHELTMLTPDFRKRDPTAKMVLKPNFSEKVALIKFYPGMDPAIIDWYVQNGFRGLLLEGSGLGHVSSTCFGAIQNAVSGGVVVALASQCIWGRVNMNVYDTGRDLLALGVVPADDMFPETALVKLMWTLGQTSDAEEAKKLFKTNIAGELSPRTLPQECAIKEGGQ